jgi:hypothetical protein
MVRTAPARTLSLLLLAALAAPAAAQVAQIDFVSPSQAGPGTEVFVGGSGFGDRGGAPKVWLEFAGQDGSEKYRMRVVEWADDHVTALVLSGEAGACQLMVKAAKQEPVGVAFKVLLPQAVNVTPSSAVPGDLVTVTGASFGPKRGHVMLFDRPCRVSEWSDTAVTFKVPATVADGDWTPRVVNSVGEAAAIQALKLSGSPAQLPPPFLRTDVDGSLFAAEDLDVVAWDLGTKVSFDAFAGVGGLELHLSSTVPFSPVAGKVPVKFSGNSAGGQPMFLQRSEPSESGPVVSLYVAKPATHPWKVHMLGKSQGMLFGQLSAVLVRFSGPGPDTLELADGMFLIDP